MKVIKILGIMLLFLTQKLVAQSWTASSGSVSFGIKMLGNTVNGNFSGLKPTIQFQNDEPVSLSATVQTNTIDTDNSLRDKHLKEKEDFFQVEKYPILTMTSTQISKINETQYLGTFKITIKTVTKLVKVPISLNKTNDQGVMKSEFIINRKDWNFGGSTMGMSDNVKVKISLNLAKK
jgi:polyisoprenoid-binding protein YceI